jgi:SH3-like domain-containing protein
MTTASGRPAYSVPSGGMPARALPDLSCSVVAHLDPGLTVELVERRGDWANIVCSNGWSAWVEARVLVDADGQPTVMDQRAQAQTLRQPPVSSAYATAATSQQQAAAGTVSWWRSRRLRLVVSLMLCVASPLIYILGA